MSDNENKLISNKPIIEQQKPSENKLQKTNLKFDTLKENNKYNLQKELICRLMTPSFYTFILIFVISIGAIITLFKMDYKDATNFWNIIIPLITTYIGYAIGKKENTSE